MVWPKFAKLVSARTCEFDSRPPPQRTKSKIFTLLERLNLRFITFRLHVLLCLCLKKFKK